METALVRFWEHWLVKLFHSLRQVKKIAAPHAKKAAKNVARELTGQVVQEVAGRIIKPRKPKKRVSKRKNVKRAAARKDIFLQ